LLLHQRRDRCCAYLSRRLVSFHPFGPTVAKNQPSGVVFNTPCSWTRPVFHNKMHISGQALVNEAVCFSQRVLLGTKEDMDDIANAIGKIYENRQQLA
jgi:hypothetical protein